MEQCSLKVKKCAAQLLGKKDNWCQAGQLFKKHGSYTIKQLIDVMSWLVPVSVAASLPLPPRPFPSAFLARTCFLTFALPVTSKQPATLCCDDVGVACQFLPEGGAIILEIPSSTARPSLLEAEGRRWRRWCSHSEHSAGSCRCTSAPGSDTTSCSLSASVLLAQPYFHPKFQWNSVAWLISQSLDISTDKTAHLAICLHPLVKNWNFIGPSTTL